MPEPSSPLFPAVTRTDTTLGSTARATAVQSGAGAPFDTSGAELAPCEEVPAEDEAPEEPDVVVWEVAEEPSLFSAMPTVSRLDSRPVAAHAATTPAQPGPRR